MNYEKFKEIIRGLNYTVSCLKYNTREDVRKALSLRPNKKIIQESKDKGYYPRRSGRTTEDLISAIYESQKCIVGIKAHSSKYAERLVKDARTWAYLIDLDPENIVPAYTKCDLVITDHYYYEFENENY